MIRKNTVFDFLESVFVIFGITVLSLCVFVTMFGNEAKEISDIFSLGNDGVSIATLIQFFWMSFLVCAIRFICFTNLIIKKLSISGRTIVMFVSVIVAVGVFAAVFHWFPVDMALPWIMFFFCFSVYAAFGVILSVMKEKKDNKELQDALERLQEENK